MKQSSKIIFCFVIILMNMTVQPLAASGDDYMFDLITSEKRTLRKGLSQNTVYSILQDRQGYLWFGTWDGLNKFDGLDFTTYNKENGLSNEVINCLLETNDGNIWIGTENGLNFLDRRSGVITFFQNNPADSTSLSDNWINYLYQTPGGKLYVCTRRGLNVLNPETMEIKRFQSRDSFSRRNKSNNIRFIVSHKNEYFIGTDFGLVRYNPQTNENIRYLNRPDDPSSLSHNQVNVICFTSDDSIWVGTEKGLNLLDLAKGTFEVFLHNPKDPKSISHNSVKAIYRDDSGNTWIGTDGGGINIIDQKSKVFTRILNQPGKPRSLNNNRVYSICQDKIGNLWFGTFKGVCKMDRYTRKFHLFNHNPDNPNTVGNNLIWAFYEMEPDVFWIGTDEGVSIFSRISNTFSHIKYDPDRNDGLSSKRIRTIIKDDFGKIWIGTRDAGLNKYDPETGRFLHFQPSIQYNNSLADNFVISLFKDRDGFIWAGTQNGLNRIDPKTDHITLYQHNPDDPLSLSNNTVYKIIEDTEGVMWIATYDGLNRYNRSQNNFTTFRKPVETHNNFSSNRFFYVFEDSNKNLWVGTRGGGLALFDRASGQFIKSYTTDDGLPNNVIYGILEDETGALWMSTNWGLSTLKVKDQVFVNYDVTDGLQSSEFNALALLKSSSGMMFFGGMNGFNMFNPKEIQSNPNKPDIVISGFKLGNQPVLGEIYNKDTVILKAEDNFFSFGFSSLDFTNPHKSQFAYMLENYNNDWTYVDGTRNFAEYTKVSPGTYFFRVTGSNSDGVWSDKEVMITVIVKPYWFQTWIFRLSLLLAFIVAIWYSIYRRYRFLQKKHHADNKMLQIENQLLDIQQKALRLQMNPHFIFNSLNSIQSFILSKDIDQAVNYLSRFSQLMRMIMTNSTEAVIPLSNEILAVSHYLEIEKLRFDNKFSYQIYIAPEIDEEFTGVPPMIIQPYIENAIIHGLLHKNSNGKIDIRFEKIEQTIHCIITDDGIGRAKSFEIKMQTGLNQKSRGMMISKERLDFFNKNDHDIFSVIVIDLFDDEGNPSGTKVELFIDYHEL